MILPVLKDTGAKVIIEAGVPVPTVYNVLGGKGVRHDNRAALETAAAAYAVRRLRTWGVTLPDGRLAVMISYVTNRDRRGENARRCEWCGHFLSLGVRADTRYHSSCRQARRRGQREAR